MTDKQKVQLAAAVLAIVIATAIAALSPYLEMRTFNRCTGSHATYLDAVFSNLRVTECRR